MADNVYELIIRADVKSKETDEESANGKEKKEKKVTFRQIGEAATAAIGLARVVKNSIQFELSMVGVRTGNSHLQSEIDFGVSTAQQVIGITSAFVANPIAGAIAAIGAGVGLLQNIDRFQEAAKWDNIALQQSRTRAGATWNGSRKEGR